MNTFALLEDILAVLPHGGSVTYSELLALMKFHGRPTAAVGSVIEDHAFRRGGVGLIVAWREPTWDPEHEGGWADGTLWIKRQPNREDWR